MIGKEIFIVGAGISLEGFDFSKLEDQTTIAVNRSVQDVPEPTYFLTADSGIASQVRSYIDGIDTVKVLVYTPTHRRVKLFRNAFADFDVIIKYSGGNPTVPIGFRFNEFQSGQNSGFCALQFAVIMGYSPIYLLGIDLVATGGRFCRHQDKPMGFQRVLDEFFAYFEKALTVLRQTDIKVCSCSPVSRLNSIIPYVSIDNALYNSNLKNSLESSL